MLKNFLEKRENGELLIQRSHKLLETILKKVANGVLNLLHVIVNTKINFVCLLLKL